MEQKNRLKKRKGSSTVLLYFGRRKSLHL